MTSKLITRVNSSVVKKNIQGVTGLLLCGFLVTHLAGNCLIYFGREAFNTYGHTLITNPLIIPAEIVLLAIFFTHIFLGFKLIYENKKARPVNYYVRKPTGRGSTFASSTMPITGFIVLFFLIWHICQIKFGPHYTVVHNGVEMRDLYRLLVEYFQNKLNIAGYIFTISALGIHVSHGFWSAFQSIGFNHPKYNCTLKCLSKLYAVVITLGYCALPIYLYFQGGR